MNCSCNKSYIGETKRNNRIQIQERLGWLRQQNNTVLLNYLKHNSTYEINFGNDRILDTKTIENKKNIRNNIHKKTLKNCAKFKMRLKKL